MRGTGSGIAHASISSSRIRALHRPVVVVTLAFMSVASFPGVASATPGAKLWGQRYNGPKDRADQAYALGMSPDGSTLYVTGASVGLTSGADFATVAYNASTGAQLWTGRYNGPGNRADHAIALGVSPDGSKVFVTGSSFDSSSGPDYATVAYDASTGVRLWAKRYTGPGDADDSPKALGVSPDGSKVFVTGWSIGLSATYDYATVAYDTSSGAKLWTKRYNGPAHSNDLANALGLSPDGSMLYVTGQSAGSPAIYEMTTIAYDTSTGVPGWTKRYNDPDTADDAGRALAVSPDGSTVFVTGFGLNSSTSYDYSTVALDAATGADLWAKRYDGPLNSDDLANAIRVRPDGSQIFVTGQSFGHHDIYYGYDVATVAYDAATGAKLWSSRYNSPSNGDDLARALEVSPDGSTLFMTGTSYGSTSGPDFGTWAYDASSGTRLWARRYNGPGNADDQAFGLAMSPDASAVFVTGPSFGSGTGFDYATVAYDTA